MTVRKIRNISKNRSKVPVAEVHAAHDPTEQLGSPHHLQKSSDVVRLYACARGSIEQRLKVPQLR